MPPLAHITRAARRSLNASAPLRQGRRSRPAGVLTDLIAGREQAASELAAWACDRAPRRPAAGRLAGRGSRKAAMVELGGIEPADQGVDQTGPPPRTSPSSRQRLGRPGRSPVVVRAAAGGRDQRALGLRRWLAFLRRALARRLAVFFDMAVRLLSPRSPRSVHGHPGHDREGHLRLHAALASANWYQSPTALPSMVTTQAPSNGGHLWC